MPGRCPGVRAQSSSAAVRWGHARGSRGDFGGPAAGPDARGAHGSSARRDAAGHEQSTSPHWRRQARRCRGIGAAVPLIALAVVTYAAGLALGFGGVVHPAVAICVCGAVGGFIRREPRAIALAALCAAGWLSAKSALLDEGRCARARGDIVAVFPDALAPGAFVRGEARSIAGRPCTVSVTVAVRRGRVA